MILLKDRGVKSSLFDHVVHRHRRIPELFLHALDHVWIELLELVLVLSLALDTLSERFLFLGLGSMQHTSRLEFIEPQGVPDEVSNFSHDATRGIEADERAL